MTDNNTALDMRGYVDYMRWLAKQNATQGRDVSLDKADYDVQGAYKSSSVADSRGHGTDQFKKPNHPTFSTESQYSNAQHQGGVWSEVNGKPTFQPSEQMIQENFGGDTQKAADFYNNRYFPRAEAGTGVQLVLPARKVLMQDLVRQ